MANPISKLNLLINGVTTQLDVHDANALTTEIDSSGTGWVRFKSGLQICYGTATNNNGLGAGVSRFSFPMAFSATPNLVTTPNIPSQAGPHLVTVIVESGTNFITNLWWTQTSELSSSTIAFHYVAIGKWK